MFEVTPSVWFNSAVLAVRPAILFNSVVVAVTPSRMFNSPAVEVTAVLAICSWPAGMFTVPVNVAPASAAFALNCVCIADVTPSM